MQNIYLIGWTRPDSDTIQSAIDMAQAEWASRNHNLNVSTFWHTDGDYDFISATFSTAQLIIENNRLLISKQVYV